MLQPVTLAGVLALLMLGTTALAQPRAMRARSVTVATTPGEPLPEVRVAAGVKTLIVLDAPIDKGSVQLDAARLHLVDLGERSLLLEPGVTPGEKERWVLRVRYADGARPEWAAFALVSHPAEVDVQIVAARPRQTTEDCQAALAQARCEAAPGEVWVLADRLGGGSVAAEKIRAESAPGWAYRLGSGVLLVVTPEKGAVPQAWVPTVAVLRGKAPPNEVVKVRAVHVRQQPVGTGTVAVEADLPSPAAGKAFILELRDAGGQSLEVDRVTIPTAMELEGSGP